MSTRCITDVMNEDGELLVRIFRHWDGYPAGHGEEIFETFGQTKLLTDGYDKETAPEYANGMGCFAAQLIAKLKGDKIGSIYIEPAGKEFDFQKYWVIDYYYILYVKNGEIWFNVNEVEYERNGAKVKFLWDGRLADFGEFLSGEDVEL